MADAKESARHRSYYVRNRERILARTKAQRETMKDVIRERSKAYRESNKDALRETARRSYEKNRQKRLEAQKAARAERTDTERQADAEYQRSHYLKNRTARLSSGRRRKLERVYGISVEKFDAMLAAQGGKCAICSDEMPTRKGRHIDHNHVTGVVRAILCGPCNRGLGFFRDCPDRLRLAAAYIDHHEAAA